MKHYLSMFAAALIVAFFVIFGLAGLVLLFKAVIVGIGVKLFFGLVALLAAALMLAAIAQGGSDETQ